MHLNVIIDSREIFSHVLYRLQRRRGTSVAFKWTLEKKARKKKYYESWPTLMRVWFSMYSCSIPNGPKVLCIFERTFLPSAIQSRFSIFFLLATGSAHRKKKKKERKKENANLIPSLWYTFLYEYRYAIRKKNLSLFLFLASNNIFFLLDAKIQLRYHPYPRNGISPFKCII